MGGREHQANVLILKTGGIQGTHDLGNFYCIGINTVRRS